MPTALELLAIAINLACAGLNLWLARRAKQRLDRARALEARYTRLIIDQMAAKYYRGVSIRDRATPLHH